MVSGCARWVADAEHAYRACSHRRRRQRRHNRRHRRGIPFSTPPRIRPDRTEQTASVVPLVLTFRLSQLAPGGARDTPHRGPFEIRSARGYAMLSSELGGSRCNEDNE